MRSTCVVHIQLNIEEEKRIFLRNTGFFEN